MASEPRRRGSAERRRRQTTRSVQFFRLRTSSGEMPPGGQYPLAEALRQIDTLPWTLEGRYLTDGDDAVLCCWPDRSSGGQARFRLGLSRRSNLPLVEESGTLSALPIPATAGLAEITHFVEFGYGVIGVLHNPHGPRAPKAVDYLRARVGDLQPFPTLMPLLRAGVSQRIARLENIRLLNIGVHQSEAMLLREHGAGELSDVLTGLQQIGRVPRVNLILKPEPREHQGLGAEFRDLAARLSKLPMVGSIFDQFAIKGYDASVGSQVEIDVLKEHLVSRQQVVFEGQRSRSIDDASAYAAIHKAFEEVKDELSYAAEAELL